MATYKCCICGIHKNDTVTSQLNTSTTCKSLENTVEVVFHKWNLISEDDLMID
ncbi:hypothetical protein ADIWIN_3115 [Winogradskyella psychrotolerans RS-3]|uniref:Uncharacterized protein n=1 Tax=Winogradskyella psychrotolerans RS-3 TaxID=641526 RepID=S7VR89_9FLAO|nr:hypothetical protein [Winogradskyella psychrotolerans]EPR71917.1 hypothetical protein ADIWIN_3115 [Winogradskyella psychrotolerans RS-3]